MDRSLLGSADVDDATLAAMVADLLGHDDVEVLTSSAERVAYDVPALTTVGRWWVAGSAATPSGTEPFRMFVKHVQAWHHSPFFSHVPEEHRATAAASYPWRTEPLAYRSDLGDRLPTGLSMPRALGVFDLEPDAAVLWLEAVDHPAVPWTFERHVRAAHLLGRLAASPEVAPRAGVGQFDWHLMHYVHGRLAAQVVPVLRSDVWAHPLVAASFGDDLRDRLQAAADRAVDLGLELSDHPVTTAHGDASPGNLLPGPAPDSFVLIDYGFWQPQPVGFDLGQLLAGDVQLGRRSAATLPETDDACVTAYTAGLAAEGLDVDRDVVRRAHALQLLLFVGLSALPFELLDQPPSDALASLVAERAALARFSLDLVDATS